VIKPTSSDIKNHIVNWYAKDSNDSVKLCVKYINRRRKPVAQVTNLSLCVEKSQIKLIWNNPDDESFKGVYVVRNRFHKPKNHLEGDKIYAGRDDYTYDNYGSTKIDKYYAVFTYDDVPNYSQATTAEYHAKKSN